jgi:hypothetical protein
VNLGQKAKEKGQKAKVKGQKAKVFKPTLFFIKLNMLNTIYEINHRQLFSNNPLL